MKDIRHVVVLTVVFTISGIAIMSLLAGIIFSWYGAELSPFVQDSGKVAFGAMTTLLVNRLGADAKEDAPIEVEVTNDKNTPVPTEAVDEGVAG